MFLSNRLKAQILSIERGALSKAICISPLPSNPNLSDDLVRLVNAVRKKKVTSLDLQASLLLFLQTELCQFDSQIFI
jgi:hypothetical protein